MVALTVKLSLHFIHRKMKSERHKHKLIWKEHLIWGCKTCLSLTTHQQPTKAKSWTHIQAGGCVCSLSPLWGLGRVGSQVSRRGGASGEHHEGEMQSTVTLDMTPNQRMWLPLSLFSSFYILNVQFIPLPPPCCKRGPLFLSLPHLVSSQLQLCAASARCTHRVRWATTLGG